MSFLRREKIDYKRDPFTPRQRQRAVGSNDSRIQLTKAFIAEKGIFHTIKSITNFSPNDAKKVKLAVVGVVEHYIETCNLHAQQMYVQPFKEALVNNDVRRITTIYKMGINNLDRTLKDPHVKRAGHLYFFKNLLGQLYQFISTNYWRTCDKEKESGVKAGLGVAILAIQMMGEYVANAPLSHSDLRIIKRYTKNDTNRPLTCAIQLVRHIEVDFRKQVHARG